MEKETYVCTKSEHTMYGLSGRYIRPCYAPGDVMVVPSSHDSYKSTQPSRVRRLIRREIARHSRFVRQMKALYTDMRASLVIRRCLHYGDRIPRKYYRKYSEAIKRLFPEHKA